MKGIALYPDRPAERVEIEDYRDIQKIVKGMIDVVSLKNVDMYVNDSFLFEFGIEDLNETASVIAMIDGRPDLFCLLGPAVVVGPVDDEGNNTDIDENIARQIIAMERDIR